MKKIELSTVKDCGYIRDCGEFVVATGKFLWVFRKDGSFVSKSKTIRYPGKLLFLPPDRIFVEGRADYQYHYVDLLTGDDIWTVTLERKQLLPNRSFAVSADNQYLYDMYCHNVRNKWYVVRFSLGDMVASKVEVPESLRTTTGIYTDEGGILYALQTHHLTNDGKISQNGVLRIDWRKETPQFSWERMWQSERGKDWQYTDGNYILCKDYSVIDMTTMQSFDLLENDSGWRPKFPCGDCVYIPEKKILIAYHTMCDGNVVIDCKARKRIAQYAPADLTSGAGFAGCLIGDEYWIGTNEGIVRKPFPMFEEMADKASPYWQIVREGERIRGERLNKKS